MQIVVIVLGIVIVALGALLIFLPSKDYAATETSLEEEVVRPESETESEIEVTEEELAEGNPEDLPAPEASNLPAPTETIPTPREGVAASTATFTADASYLTPARTQHDIRVSLIIDNTGVVTDANVIYDNGDGFSNANQERFDRAYKTEVVGRSLDNISLARVGGASLTSGAFNEAVAKIRAERG
jgi:hypothetical protein